MTGARSSVLVWALTVGLFACGGNATGPSPKPPPSGPTPPAPPSGVRVAALDAATRSAVIQWDPAPGAERYVVEHWNTFDTSVTITSVTTNGAETTATLRDLSGDWLSVRVRAGNGAGFGDPSAPPIFLQIPIQKDIVEALFFGSGPYGTGLFAEPGAVDYLFFGQGMHHSPGIMLGWSGGPIAVRIEDALSPAQTNYLTRILAQIGELTGGYLRPEVVQRAASLPGVFQAGEIHVVVRSDLTAPCQTTDLSIVGCARQLFLTGGQLIASVIYVKPNGSPDTVSHEVGHAIGLHHVSRVQMPVRPVMSASGGPAENGFSAFEVEALRAVYGAGFRFGATRADFQARGLIN